MSESFPNRLLIDEVLDVARPIALALVNEPKPALGPNALRCNRVRPFRELKVLAGKGSSELKEAIDARSSLLDDLIQMAIVLHEVTSRGRMSAVSTLLDAGVDPNFTAPLKDGCTTQPLLVTPLCVALVKGHHKMADRLRSGGAVYDIFTACYLGDVRSVSDFLAGSLALLNAEDPASDVLQVRPLHHAVYGGHLEVVDLLLSRGVAVGKNSTPMVGHLADRGDFRMTQLLLAHEADTTRVGPGIWVLQREMADLLMEWSADVNYSEGAWIWRSCTGNNSQRDRPDLVDALLDRGANVNTRLRSASALHYTAKAGFLESPRVLLDRGADPNSLDSNDATPLIYAFKAGKRANVAAVVGWLVSGGAEGRA